MDRKNFKFINIVPVNSQAPEFAVSEIRRQYRDVGLQNFALMLSFHPVGMPARKNADAVLAAARFVMDKLRDEPMRVGVLIQSTLGHGWSGRVPITQEPWQHIVKADGFFSARMCISDERFRKYVLYAVEGVMKLKPAFLIMDDDFGLRPGECFCENHIRMFNEIAARELGSLPRSAADVIKMVETRPQDDPEVMLYARIRHQGIIDFAREVRQVIDRYDENIVCTQCTSGGAHGWISELVHTLAGKKAMPSVRVNNAIYCINQPLHFYTLTSQTYKIKNQYEEIPEVLDEADTCPQTYWGENALMFHAHLTNAILCGLTGAKIWISEFEETKQSGYQAKYESYLRDFHGFYDELYDTVSRVKWLGMRHLLTHGSDAAMTHPLKASWPSYSTDWNMGLLGTFAFPIAYDCGTEKGIYTLCETSVRFATDEQLKHVFGQNVLVDSKAAKLLTARGFAKYLGVRTVEDPRFFFTCEYQEEDKHTMGLMWEPDMAKLECISDKTEIRTWCALEGIYGAAVTKVSPCMTFFQNELGGHVATLAWTYDFTLLKVWARHRRKMLIEAVKFLNGGNALDMLMDTWQQVLVRHGIIGDGSEELIALISLSLDKISPIRLNMSRKIRQLQELHSDGRWYAIPFQQENGMLIIEYKMEVAIPVVFKASL